MDFFSRPSSTFFHLWYIFEVGFAVSKRDPYEAKILKSQHDLRWFSTSEHTYKIKWLNQCSYSKYLG
jgi:hypothetical protein